MPDDIAAKIETFFKAYRARSYSKGQMLILSGEQPEYVYYLTKGNVKQYDVTYRGDEIIINMFKPPAFFPMSLAINHAVNPYIYEADTDIVVRCAPSNAAVAFLRSDPVVLFDLLSRVYRGVDGLLGRMVHLMGGSARSRLVYELLLEARRFGVPDSDGCVLLRLNEREIGARAGLTRETVSRELRKLKTGDKIITLDKQGIYLRNLAALEGILGREM